MMGLRRTQRKRHSHSMQAFAAWAWLSHCPCPSHHTQEPPPLGCLGWQMAPAPPELGARHTRLPVVLPPADAAHVRHLVVIIGSLRCQIAPVDVAREADELGQGDLPSVQQLLEVIDGEMLHAASYSISQTLIPTPNGTFWDLGSGVPDIEAESTVETH